MREIAPHIGVDPEVRFGKLVIAGTRVTVAEIVQMIAGGMTTDEIAREYDLTAEQIQAAFRYTARIVADEDIAVTA